MIRLVSFHPGRYAGLISWIDSEELLVQFAGPSLSYPLTIQQLEQTVKDPARISFGVEAVDSGNYIGHCEIYLTGDSAKFGRILVGEKEQRGRGRGKQIVSAMIEYASIHFKELPVELNVFDWNHEAIRCYQKLGFKVNPGKILERKIKDQTWIALNMILDREQWEQYLSGLKNNPGL